MNSPFPLPQGSAAQPVAAQTRVITITKPADGHSYTVQLSHDGSVKLDLSQIANEKITIVKVPSDIPGAGEKAIIIFDNQAAITIDPFFFSGQWPLQLTIDTGTQHDLTVSDFASIFPVTTDTSIIPAGGEQAQQSGATFEPPSVDPISSGDPLPLLPPEELPNWQITPLLANEFINDLPAFGINPDVLLDEDFLSKANGAPFDGNQDLPAPSPGDDAGSFALSGLLHYDFHNDGPAATNPILVDTVSLNALGLHSSGAAVVFDWNPVTFTLTGYVDNDGTPGLSGGDKTVVKLVIDPATATGPGNDHSFTVTLFAPLDHTVSGTEDNITLPLQITITDSNNDADAGVVNVVVDDDLPFVGQGDRDWTLDEDVLPTGNDALDTPSDPNDFTLIADKNLGIQWGADGPGTLTIAQTDSTHPIITITDQNGNPVAGPLQSNGVDLAYNIITNADGGQTLTATAGANTIFTITLDPDAGPNGTFTFDLQGHLDHPADDGQNQLDLNFGFTATDFDSDPVPSNIVIRITDDVPYVVGQAENVSVNENDIFTLTSQGTSPFDGHTESGTGAAIATGNLSGLVAPGVDTPITWGFTSDQQTIAYMESLGLFSKQTALPDNGQSLTYTVTHSGNDVILSAFEPPTPGIPNSGNIVFSFTLDSQSGDFTFRLFDELIHVTDDGTNTDLRSGGPTDGPGGTQASIPFIDFGSIITATDFDGDSVALTDKVHVTVVDDIPQVHIGVDPIGIVQHDETPGVQNSIFQFPTDLADSDTNSAAVKAVFATLEAGGQTGNDPDVPPASGAIGYAQSILPVVFNTDPFGLNFGADFPPEAVTFSLQVTDETFSGVKTTEGVNVYLYNESGLIVGRLGNDSDATADDPNANGTIAFAIAIEPDGRVDLAQYLSLHHPNTNSDDENISLADGAVSAVLSVTDSDGDTVSDSADISGHIRFDDDGPDVHVGHSGVDADTLLVNLDETVQPDNATNPNSDRYNTAETESGGGASNGGADDVVQNAAGPIYNRTPVVETAPDSSEAIGHLTTAAGSLAALFTVNPSFGADGPGSPSIATSFTLGLAGGSVLATTLTATALAGTALETMTAGQRAIFLVQNGNTIEGRIPGTAAGGDEFVVFRISLDNASDPANAQLAVDQFLPIDHGGTENPSVLDEVASLFTTGRFAAVRLTETVTITDGDGDPDTSSSFVNLITRNSTILTFDDDGPQPASLSEPNLVNNGLLFDGFIQNGNIWGPGSGVATGTAGDWTIAASPVGGAAHPQLERVGEPYAGTDSPTNSLIVDLEATPGNIQISQDVGGLVAGAKYLLTFEVGEANFGNAKLEVVWDGNVVATIDPNPGLLQTISLELLASNGTETLIFREAGTSGDNTGTFLANVRFTNLIIIDETPNVDADSNDTLDPAVAAMFASVNLPGSDPDMGSPQFATGTSTVVSVTAADFGTDGPAAHDPVQYGLHVASSGIDSGLATTENKAIKLFLENGIIVGRYDSNNSNTVDATDNAAFAIAIDADTGILSVAQYVSLHHPDITDTDEGIQLAPDTVLVDVTLTDGDGDKSLASTDISNAVLFEDDGPTLTVDFGRQHADLSLALDETVQPDNAGNPNFDHYDGAEAESGGGASNGGADDVISAAGPLYNHTPVVSLSPLASQAIGSLTTVTGAIATQFNVSAIFGADGPGPNGGLSENLSLVLSSNGAGTNLHATDTGDPLLAGLSENARAIYLVQTGNVIEGRIAGADEVSNGGPDEYVAFRITLNNASDPSTASITVDQFMAIEHGDISTFDENAILRLVGQDTLGLKLDVTATDGDLDPVEKSVTLNLANNDGSFISFDDDGPTVKDVTPTVGPNLVQNGSFEQGHGDIGSKDWNIYDSLTGGWTTGSDNIPFEVQTGGAGGLGAEDGNTLIELDGDTQGNPSHTPQGTPDPVHTDATIQQIVSGTEAGQTYELSFWYAPRPGDGTNSSGMQVFFEGNLVHDIPASPNPPAGWQLITLQVTATGPNSVLAFTGTGSENEFGAFLDNVSLHAVTILDDEDTTLDPAIEVQGGPGDDGHGVVATGKIDIDPGTDGLHSIAFNEFTGLQAIYVDGTGKGTPEDVSVHWTQIGAGGELVGTSAHFDSNNPVFTLTVDANGNYIFTLNAPLDHPAPDGNPPSFENNLLLNLGFTVTDGDGDTATGSVDVNIDDDSPLANNDVDTIHMLAGVSGNVITGAGSDDPVAAQDTPGADGGQITGISFGQTNATPDANGDFTIGGDHGTLVLNEDGSYTYTRSDTSAGQDVFTYTLTDGDGDHTTATLTINLDTQTTPLVVGAGFNGVVEEEQLGHVDNPAFPPSATGNEDTGSVLGNDQDTGTTPPGSDVTTNAATGALSVTGGTGPYTFQFSPGVDGQQAAFTDGSAVTSSGNAVLYSIQGTTLVGYVNIGASGYVAGTDHVVFTIALNSASSTDGTDGYTFTLYDHLDHDGALDAQFGDNQEGTLSLDLAGFVTVSDSSGVNAPVTLGGAIDVIDDRPIALQGQVTEGTVYEDGLTLANSNNESIGNPETSHTDTSLTINATDLASLVSFGADKIGPDAGFTLASFVAGAVKTTGGDTVLSKGVEVDYANDGNDIVGLAGSREVFRLVDNGNGTFTFTLEDQIDHIPNTPPDNDTQTLALNLASAFAATDNDGDTVQLTNGVLAVSVEDDIPFFAGGPSSATVTQLDTAVGGSVDLHIGADEPPHFGVTPPTIDNVTADTQTDSQTGIVTITGTFTDSGDPFYVFTFDPATGGYTFELDGLPTATTPLADIDLSNAFAPVPQKDFGPFTFIADAGHDVNGSAQGTGVDDDNLEGGEHLTIQFDDPMTVANVGLNFVGNHNVGIDIAWTATDSATGHTQSGTGHIDADGTLVITANGVDITQFDKLELTGLGNSNSEKVKIVSLGGTEITENHDVGPFVFNVDSTDFDGDHANTTITINTDIAPLALLASDGFSGTVEEEQLVHLDNPQNPTFNASFTGNEDTNSALGNDLDTGTTPPDSNVTTNVIIGTVSVSGGTGPYDFNFNGAIEGQQATFTGNQAITSNGAPVLYHIDGNTLIGYVNSGASGYVAGTDHVVFTLGFTENGSANAAYTFTLYDHVDHNGAQLGDNVEGTLSLDLGNVLQVTDASAPNQTVTLSGSVGIIDDVPVAAGDTADVTEGQGTKSDLVVVVDVSNSMDEHVDVDGNGTASNSEPTRLDLARQALNELVSNSNVDQVKIVLFHGDASSTAWMTAAQALDFISHASNFTAPGSGTNYDAALFDSSDGAVQAFDTQPATPADNRIVYFLSDGQPTEPGGNDTGIQSGEESSWITFLDNNNVSAAYAVGFGDLSTGDANALEPVAWTPGETQPTHSTAAQDDKVLIVDDQDFTQLGATLSGTVPGAADGNVSAGTVSSGTGGADSFGADGGRILSVQVDGKVYTWDGANTITVTDATTHAVLDTHSGNSVSEDTALGGHLNFFFATGSGHTAGDWNYASPASVSQDETETFHYTAVDGDGDVAGADLLVNVHDTVPVTANDDIVLTNIVDGSDIVVPSGAMIFNDVPGTGPGPLTITGVNNPVGGTVALGSAIFTPDSTGPQTLIDADFSGDGNLDGFNAHDEGFRGTNAPGGSEDEDRDNSGNGGNNGSLRVRLGNGNGDDDNLGAMSGGWSQSFNLAVAAAITIAFDYRLQLPDNTDSGENGQVLVSVDGTLHGTTPNDYVDQLLGANSSSDLDTGWKHFEVTLNLGAGNHTLDLGAYMTSANDNGERTTAFFDNVSVTAPGHPFASGSYDYTVTDGSTSDDGHVVITGQDGDTITGTAVNEILIGKDGHVHIDANISEGSIGNSGNNQFGFSFTEAAAAGDFIKQITIDISGHGNSVFDLQGNGSGPFTLGSNSDITNGDILGVTSADNSDALVITFDDGAFTQGKTLHFGVDVDPNNGSDTAASFGSDHVPFTVTLNDGTVLNGVYESGAGNTAVASLSGGAGSTLLGEGGDDYLIGGTGNDTLVGGTGNDIVSGGAGADHFHYDALGEGGDHILDYSASEGDTFDVLVSGFAGLSPADAGKTADQVTGLFDADTTGTEATTVDARFHFDAANHTLYYDSDGSGGGASHALATFDNDATIQAQNVHLV